MEIDINKKYRTRDGREVRIYATDGFGAEAIHGAIRSSNGAWLAYTWGSDGSSVTSNNSNLIEVKPRIKRTVRTC